MRAQTPTRAAPTGRAPALLVLLALLALALPGPALAQARPSLDALGDAFPRGAPPMPVCNAPRDGVAACLAGRQCLCGYERGGSITGRPDGWRWDCSASRPACDVPPADLPGSSAPPPTVLPQILLPDGGADRQPFRTPFR